MKKRISMLIAASGIALTAAAAGAAPGNPGIRQSGDVTIVDAGDNHVEFQDVSDMHGEYRIFGINANSEKNSPVGYIDAFVPMISLKRDREIFKESGPRQCELLAAKEQTTVSIIFADDAIKNQFLSYQEQPKHGHFALRITGTIMHKTKDLYKGQSMEGMTVSGPISIDSVLLLKSAEIVPWQDPQEGGNL